MRKLLAWLLYDAWSFTHNGWTYRLDWDAVAAVASGLAMIVAVVAIAYSVRLVQRQLAHQSTLEAKAAERSVLAGILEALRQRYETVREFGTRLETELETADVVTQPVRSAVDALLTATSKSTALLAAQLHVVSAVRDHHASLGQSAAVRAYDDILHETLAAHQATKNFEQWALRILQPATPRDQRGFSRSPFEQTETTHNQAMLAVAKRIAALLTPGANAEAIQP